MRMSELGAHVNPRRAKRSRESNTGVCGLDGRESALEGVRVVEGIAVWTGQTLRDFEALPEPRPRGFVHLK